MFPSHQNYSIAARKSQSERIKSPKQQILSFLADKIAKNPPELLYKWLRDNNYKLNISRNTYYNFKIELKEEILEKGTN